MMVEQNNSTKYYNGSKWQSNLCGEFEIVGKLGKKYYCKFLDGSIVLRGYKEIRNGNINSPMLKTCHGVGCIGNGKFKPSEHKKVHMSWSAMLNRVYGGSYKNVTICDEWHNFQNYAEHYYKTYPKELENLNLSLDKDLLQLGKENKVYSPETCVWLPTKINSFMTNKQDGHNTSGYTGVSENTNKKGYWRAQINDFETGKYICINCNCKTKEEAYELYLEYRAKNAEKVKEYLRSLNYLSEEIIQLIK